MGHREMHCQHAHECISARLNDNTTSPDAVSQIRFFAVSRAGLSDADSIYGQNLEFEFVREPVMPLSQLLAQCHAVVHIGSFTCQGRLSGCIQHAMAATLRRLDPSQHIVPQQVKHISTWLALVLLPEDVSAGDARVGGHAVYGAACCSQAALQLTAEHHEEQLGVGVAHVVTPLGLSAPAHDHQLESCNSGSLPWSRSLDHKSHQQAQAS